FPVDHRLVEPPAVQVRPDRALGIVDEGVDLLVRRRPVEATARVLDVAIERGQRGVDQFRHLPLLLTAGDVSPRGVGNSSVISGLFQRIRTRHESGGTHTMTVGPNDVNLLSVETNDENFPAGTNITFKVSAEVGAALHGTGGKYQVRLTLTDTTAPALV